MGSANFLASNPMYAPVAFELARRPRRVNIKPGLRRSRIEFTDIDDLMSLMKNFEQPSRRPAKRGDKS